MSKDTQQQRQGSTRPRSMHKVPTFDSVHSRKMKHNMQERRDRDDRTHGLGAGVSQDIFQLPHPLVWQDLSQGFWNRDHHVGGFFLVRLPYRPARLLLLLRSFPLGMALLRVPNSDSAKRSQANGYGKESRPEQNRRNTRALRGIGAGVGCGATGGSIGGTKTNIPLWRPTRRQPARRSTGSGGCPWYHRASKAMHGEGPVERNGRKTRGKTMSRKQQTVISGIHNS